MISKFIQPFLATQHPLRRIRSPARPYVIRVMDTYHIKTDDLAVRFLDLS